MILAQSGGREPTEDSSRPNKMLQWACTATRDTEDQLLSWFTSARSHITAQSGLESGRRSRHPCTVSVQYLVNTPNTYT